MLACHRTVVSTTPDLHSNPWGFVVLTRPLRLTLHLGASLFNASIAFDALDPRTKTTRPLMACQAQRTAKSNQTNCNKPNTTRSARVLHVCPACSPRVSTCLPRVYHVSTTCSPRVHHVFTTCSRRVHHVFTTCSPRVHHVFTTCSPRVHHVFTTCSPRVHHVFTTCSPRVHHVFTTCSPRVHHVSARVHHVFTTC